MVYRRSWLPREMPLSGCRPTAKGHSPVQVAINANVVAGPLRSQSLDFGWGLGVGAAVNWRSICQVGVRSFTRLDLPRSGRRQGAASSPAFSSTSQPAVALAISLLVGSETVADTGSLVLTGPAGRRRLAL
jgi:hypothetical protein